MTDSYNRTNSENSFSTFLLILVLIAVVVAGIWWFRTESSPVTTEVPQEGDTVNVDVDLGGNATSPTPTTPSTDTQ